MFLDYYQILEVDFSATAEDIKAAYRRQSIKWHPDKNPGNDTLTQMQQINEAYLLLKDEEARIRYNQEYILYKLFLNACENPYHRKDFNDSYQYNVYNFKDEVLKKWMHNARDQAQTLAYQTAIDFKRGATAAGEEVLKSTLGFLVVGVIFSLIFILGKTCN